MWKAIQEGDDTKIDNAKIQYTNKFKFLNNEKRNDNKGTRE